MNPLAQHWRLDPAVDFLNHGSFGACPIRVLEAQQALRDELEAEPVDFFVRRLGQRLDGARSRLAEFIGADPEGVVPVSNATSGVNAVLRSLEFDRGSELLVTDHGYNACCNALRFVAERSGARVVVAKIPFPLSSTEQVERAVLSAVTSRTRLALLDHVTSPTGIVVPVGALTRLLDERGIDTLVDGAHAPGMLDLDVEAIGAAYYTGNCHKWICAPKGAAFLYVRSDRRDAVRPLTISHGANTPRPGRSRLHDEFDWTGTGDPTAFLCVPTAIDVMQSMVPGGWPEIRRLNRELALDARSVIRNALGLDPPCPDAMIGSLASLPLPEGSPRPLQSALYTDPLQEALRFEQRIEVPIVPWPAPPRRLVRISAQLYNRAEQYQRLAGALSRLIA